MLFAQRRGSWLRTSRMKRLFPVQEGGVVISERDC